LIDQSGPRQWRQDEVVLAGQLAAQAAIAIENAGLYKAEQVARQTAEAMQETARIVNASLDLDHALNLLLEQLTRIVPYDSAAIFLREGELLCGAAGRGFPDIETVTRLAVHTADNALMRQAIETGRPVVLTDAQKDERFEEWVDAHAVRGWIGVPLLVGTELVGVLTIDSRQAGAYDEESTRLAQALADQTAVAIHKARLLDDLQRANRELRQLDELKDQMIQNIAHELRTPLTLVQGNLSLLQEGDLDPATQRQAIQTAVTRTKTLVQLVEGITTLQDLSLEGTTPQPMKTTELAEMALKLAGQKADRAGINLYAEYPPDLPSWPGDLIQLSQAIYQLLDNAIKFSPDGGSVVLHLSIDPETQELQIEVADQGIGVPPEEQKQIFDLFYQVDGTTTRRFGGTGLGLAIVQRVVQAHGGRVWVESPKKSQDAGPGPGSRFIIRLPRPS
jgi:signal transduction histidine kinase